MRGRNMKKQVWKYFLIAMATGMFAVSAVGCATTKAKPAAEKPAAEKPAAEKPAAEHPKSEHPKSEHPKADEPASQPAADPSK
jgi:hypothetical protein